jgi:hypothetical protein
MLKSLVDTQVKYIQTPVIKFQNNIKRVLEVVLETVSGEKVTKLLEENMNLYNLKDIVIILILNHYNHNSLILNTSYQETIAKAFE